MVCLNISRDQEPGSQLGSRGRTELFMISERHICLGHSPRLGARIQVQIVDGTCDTTNYLQVSEKEGPERKSIQDERLDFSPFA